jgi:hypothetical protein
MLLVLVLPYRIGYGIMILFFSLGCTMSFFCMGVYVVSVPGYNLENFRSRKILGTSQRLHVLYDSDE